MEACEQRDPKGLYKKRALVKLEFTGISAPYEAPHQPEITINTEHQSVEESVNTIIEYLKINNISRSILCVASFID